MDPQVETYTPQKVLKKYFGYDQFRSFQEEVIETIMKGKDCLVVMPSGGGKSICYQVPALLLEGITVVISPLISLMKDQVESLLANGIEAAFINSSIPFRQQEEIVQSVRDKKIKILYVSPEKLLTDSFTDFLKNLKIGFFAIDEAHCISTWGHDFRPEYARLLKLKQTFPEIAVVALTATADKLTRADICQQLQLRDPVRFLDSFDRPNLSLNVLPAKNRFGVITGFISERPHQSGIIYCLSRKSTEKLSEKLNGAGISSLFYHAGMDAAARTRVHEKFINDDIPVICATIAFGMGIDKSNVRWIIHYNLPKNLEGYYQEIGRAGRDGLPADTLLFYSFGDVVTLKEFAMASGQPDVQLAKLERMQQYAEAPTCRRKILLNYFNEYLAEDCGNCDICKSPPDTFDGSILAQKALSAILRLNEKVPTGLLIDILRGSAKREIFENGYHNIKTYGAGKDLGYFDWQQYLLQMLHQGLFEIAYDENRNLKITEAGKKVLYEQMKVPLVQFLDFKEYREKLFKRPEKVTKRERLENDLFETLRTLRKKLADEQGMPAYIVFSDRTLREMASERPVSHVEMIRIPGVGEHKFKLYGEIFINEIIQFRIKEKDKGSTYLETMSLLKQGLTLIEIAEKRQLNPGTILGHMAELYEKGENISLENFVSREELNKIGSALKSFRSPPLMKDLYENLNGEIDYGKLRLGMAYFTKNNK